ncbi:hypothetical protein B4N89_41730 [Embleya scabrispora]|uniref:Uncharacterized protein n=1 Tax=Embleya scabrispora TaxID=159449 RepID=A0A1T3NKC2_9ACTN|nr:hypothetical protein [Embleya scabrispora]OPC77091.1 hypothetical protein B4N89_41730 [Embleya scabrispora]
MTRHPASPSGRPAAPVPVAAPVSVDTATSDSALVAEAYHDLLDALITARRVTPRGRADLHESVTRLGLADARIHRVFGAHAAPAAGLAIPAGRRHRWDIPEFGYAARRNAVRATLDAEPLLCGRVARNRTAEDLERALLDDRGPATIAVDPRPGRLGGTPTLAPLGYALADLLVRAWEASDQPSTRLTESDILRLVGRYNHSVAAAIRSSGRRCPCRRPPDEHWVTAPRLALLMACAAACAHGDGQRRARWWVETRPPGTDAHLARALSERVPTVR